MKIRRKNQNALLDKPPDFQPANLIGSSAVDSLERIRKAKGIQKTSLKEIFAGQAHQKVLVDLREENLREKILEKKKVQEDDLNDQPANQVLPEGLSGKEVTVILIKARKGHLLSFQSDPHSTKGLLINPSLRI